MKELHFPDDFKSLPIIVVKENTPAWRAFKRLCTATCRPGTVLPVSDEEFESLKRDALVVPVE